MLHYATLPAESRPDDRYDVDTPDPISIRAWRANKQPATPRDQLGPPPATGPPAILIQKSPPARGTSISSASSSATATPICSSTPVAKVQAKVPPAKAALPPLVEETPPPEAPRPPTPTAEERRRFELETDRRMEAAKASFAETRHAREEREMRTSYEAIQAGYEDSQRRAMAQRDAEMARMRPATLPRNSKATLNIRYTALTRRRLLHRRPRTESRPQCTHHCGLHCYATARR